MRRSAVHSAIIIGTILAFLGSVPLEARAQEPVVLAAEVVWGQPSFTSNASNNGGVSATSLNQPADVGYDHEGNFFVVDSGNHRVLRFPLENGYVTTIADVVWGQPNFASNAANNGGASAATLNNPTGIAFDREGNLFVVDSGNHRVLRFPLENGYLTTTADVAWGQPSFTATSPNNGGVSAASLNSPGGIAFDREGMMYVADTGNHRVLRFPLENGYLTTTADVAWGQPDLTANTPNNNGVSATSLNGPSDVAFDREGVMHIADSGNHRVTRYPLENGYLTTTADYAWGQPDLASNDANAGGINAKSFNNPSGLAFDREGMMYVADTGNHRVLRFPLENGFVTVTADVAWGQPDFASNDPNNGAVSAASLNTPRGVAFSSGVTMAVADSANHRVLGFPTPGTPQITQPSDQRVLVNQVAKLAVTVIGDAARTYQWYQGKRGDTSRPLGTAATYTTPNLTSTTSYWVRVTNAIGSRDSDTIRVVVSPVRATFLPSANTFALENLTATAVTVNVAIAPNDPVSFTVPARTQRFLPRGRGSLRVTAGADVLATLQAGTANLARLTCGGRTATLWAGKPNTTRNVPTNTWTLVGTGGNDVIVGTSGKDTITTGLGSNVACGSDGNDTINGHNGVDVLYGGSGNDVLRGGNGNDILVGNGGVDGFRGDDGNDSLHVDGIDNSVSGGNGTDTVNGTQSPQGLRLDLGTSGIERAYGSALADVFTSSRIPDSAPGVTIYGQDGDDEMTGSTGPDSLNGDNGTDTLHGGVGNDTLRGGMDGDTLRGGIGNDRIQGDAGVDTLEGEAGNDAVYPDSNDMVIRGGTGVDTVNALYASRLRLNLGPNGFERAYGSAGNDGFTSTTLPDGASGVIVYGRAGDDQITGSPGSDQLVGEDGNDTIRGANGNDVLTGGKDRDTFSGGAGTDRVTDFVASEDTKDNTIP